MHLSSAPEIGHSPYENSRFPLNTWIEKPRPLRLPIYLDFQATTPVAPQVLSSMLPYFTDTFGNPSSRSHPFGWQAQEAVETARESVADLLGADVGEILFTSGATEANNLALQGAALAANEQRRHLITVATEHPSVLDTCRRLANSGFELTVLPVKHNGLLDLQLLADAITERTLLVSVMYAQNEIGVIQPLHEIATITHAHGALLHTDAVQAVGVLRLNLRSAGIDLLSLSSHKLYGPKGVGALYCRRSSSRILRPLMEGGGQERGLRPGSLNVPAIVGLGTAARLAQNSMSEEGVRVKALRDRLAAKLKSNLDGIRFNGSMDHRLPNNLNVSFEGVDGESLLNCLKDIAVSNGSACSSAAHKPSHVLTALGVSEALALATLRFGLGRPTTDADIDYAANHITQVVRQLRQL